MGTTAEKLAYLKETKNRIKQALETPYNVMRDYPALIKKYIDNQPTNTVSDGNCTNALNVPLVSLGIDGNSYQGENPSPENPQNIEVIDGVNLFDKNKAEVGKEINGSDGTTSNNNKYFTSEYFRVKPNTKYTLSGQKTGNSNCFYDKNKNFISTVTANNTTFTSPNNADVYYMRFNSRIEAIDTTQLVAGTTPKPYLPYGCIGLEQSGLNKLKLTLQTNTKNGITYTNNGDGTFNVNGTATENTRFELNSNLLDVIKLNTSYYVYTSVAYNIDTFNVSVAMRKKSNNAMIWMMGGKVSISPNEELNFARLDLYFKSGTTVNQNNVKIMLVESAVVDDEWEPYHEPVIHPINLNGNSIAKVGDVKDLLKVYRNGDVEIKKLFDIVKSADIRISGKSGTTRNNSFVTNNFAKFKKPASDGEVCNLLSNYFIKNSGVELYNKSLNGIAFRIGKDFVLGFTKESDITTVELATEWLNTHNLEIYNELKEPQIIKLPSIEPISLWEGTNKFELITNLDTTFEMEYVVNKDYLETQNLLNIVEGENI